MLKRVTILISEQEHEALETMAGAEMRQPREHLRYMLFQAARDKGLLTDVPEKEKHERRKGNMRGGQALSIVR